MEVKTLEELKAIQKPKENELVKVLENNSYYVYHQGEWEPTEPGKISASLYDLNKQVYAKLSNLSKSSIRAKIKDYVYDNHLMDAKKGRYYMLLNNEKRYYTVFALGNDGNTFLDELVDLLNSFDNIKAIEPVEGGCEIWATYKGDIALFMLFDYTQGVIECQ